MARRTNIALGIGVALAIVAAVDGAARADNWPMFRHDIARSAVTSEAPALPLTPQWVFVPRYAPEPAWPEPGKEKDRVNFDAAFHVAAVGDAVYFASSADNKVYCLDAATGQVRWAAITGGPIRVAPTVADGRVYVGSDDGCAYCFNAADGRLVWQVRAAFRDEKVVGNGKVISLWPIRTGVLVDGGKAYFGAGVFPNESLFLCAVKADDGTVIWRNDAYGEEGYNLEFGGISPQGALLATDSTLFVPSGRAMPAAFNRDDGRFLYFASSAGHNGGSWALLADDRLVAGVETKQSFDQQRGLRQNDAAYAWFPGVHLVVAPGYAYMLNFNELVALDRKAFGAASQWRSQIEDECRAIEQQMDKLKDARAQASPDEKAVIGQQLATLGKQNADLVTERKRVEDGVHRWRRPCTDQEALMLAGDVLVAGGIGEVSAASTKTGQEVWKTPIEGKAFGLALANGRLLVSTDTGKIYCFGTGGAGNQTVAQTAAAAAPYPEDALTAQCAQAAEQIVAQSGLTKGYCLVYGGGTGRLAYELAKRTDLRVVAVDPDPRNVESARQALDAAGVLGNKILVEQGNLDKLPYSNYFANLVVSETMLTSGMPQGSAAEILRVVKPCGGVTMISGPAQLDNLFKAGDNYKSETLTAGAASWLKITRGALPGAGGWTHEYADTGNTACSDEMRVKGPLGVLWFGPPGTAPIIERHSRPTAPVALDGRLFIQGEDVVMACDAYNGLPLWEKAIPDSVRVRVDSDMGNLALEHDALYVAVEDKCLRLEPATGETVRTFTIPGASAAAPRRWGYIACVNGTLFGSSAAPLKETYGQSWREAVKSDGTWRSVDEVAAQYGLNEEDRKDLEGFRAQFPVPNERAFWAAQQSGLMWRTMTQWPAWGSVQRPVGAVTDRIMASTSFFALDPATGEPRWVFEGRRIAHPAIAIGDALVFLADCSATDDQKAAAMQQRKDLIAQGVWEKDDIEYGPADADVRRVVALDAATGQVKWDRIMDLTGCGGDRMGLGYRDGVLCFFGCFSNHDRNLFKSGQLKWRRITAVAGPDGKDLWSRPLNYLRRPVIMADRILIEPRGCDLRTGAIRTRQHPLTGEETPWEFVRPGHCCSITSACPEMFFLRGFHLWYYDIEKDQGMQPFGGIRPGCWINTIPANGLVLFPEAAAGCTCSYPIRSTVALEPKSEQRNWALCVQHGKMTPVQHMAVNFGAPGDWRDPDGTLWFGYPHPPRSEFYEYGVNFSVAEEFYGDGENRTAPPTKQSWFCRNFEGAGVQGTEKPWLFSSGCRGIASCTLPLLGEGDAPAIYTVRLYFADAENAQPGQRVCTVKLQDKNVLRDFDIVEAAGAPNTAVVKEFKGIKVDAGLRVDLVAKKDARALNELPLLNAIEVVREDVKVAGAGGGQSL